ncbi:PRC-barrel domain [Seminavis robusta]|uniref:PRC-barrel domain n=1 Tax=Seminavis robusta TaxID=568900 RepID=A0A9N8EHJ3_9STRA|nr:PRC-barrel domain [Seminavis robusta]|eukprot:Sro962_g225090.1 PRC-barrel domain (555) ;mRNA; f:10867-12621
MGQWHSAPKKAGNAAEKWGDVAPQAEETLGQAEETLKQAGNAARRWEGVAPQAEQTLGQAGNAAEKLGNLAPQAEQTLEQAGNAAEKLGNLAPQAEQTLTQAGNAAEKWGDVAPRAEQTLKQAGNAAEKLGNLAPQAEQTLDQAGNAAEKLGNLAPQAEKTLGQAEQTFGQAEQTLGQAEQTLEQGGKNFEDIANTVTMVGVAAGGAIDIVGAMAGISGGLYAANQLVRLCQQLGLIEMPTQHFRVAQLDETNDIARESMNNKREGELVDTVVDMAGPIKMKMAELMRPSNDLVASGKTGEAWFFFSCDNWTALRLRGKGYWAFHHLKQLFEAVHAFNAICQAAETNEDLSSKEREVICKRRSVICFLDGKGFPQDISHATFPSYFRNIEIFQHSRARGSINFHSIFVEDGCRAKLEYVQVRALESRGETELSGCVLGFPKDTPCIFADPETTWENQYGVGGNVTCYNGCRFSNSKVDLIRRSCKDEDKEGAKCLTVVNASAKDWKVRIESKVGVSYFGQQAVKGDVLVPANESVVIGHTRGKGGRLCEANMVY